MANKVFTEKLKIQILDKRSNIRIHAFVNTWVHTMRRKLSREAVKKTDKFFFLSNDLHILQATCITNKNIIKNTI